ncbi:MAG TPA: hypothetical protein VGM19_14405 [Armatimonadota bacterium]
MTIVLDFLGEGIVAGLAAAALARPRQWLWVGFAVPLLGVLAEFLLAPANAVFGGPSSGPRWIALQLAGLILGAVGGAAVVRGLRAWWPRAAVFLVAGVLVGGLTVLAFIGLRE